MVTNLEKFKAERDSIDSKVSFIEQRVNTHPAAPLSEHSVTNFLKMITQLEVELENVHKKILHADPADAATSNTDYIKILENLMNQRCTLETIDAAFPRAGPSHTPTPPTTNSDIRLPRLELPTFTGDLTQWLPYRDMFVATVDKNKSLTNTEKLIHLKRSLQGEAARVIETLQLTEANYTIAWDALTSRYQNERELLFTTMKRVFTQKEVASNSASSIRNLVDVTKSSIRYFTQLGGTVDNVFVYLLFTKFDSQTRELWLQTTQSSSIPTPDEVYKFLEQRATAIAAGGSSSSSNQSKQFRPDNKTTKSGAHHQAHHGQASEACSLKCSNSTPHRLFKCTVFLGFNVTQRIDHLKKTNICFNCLTPGHSASDCRSTFTCRHCGRKHNTLIHNPSYQKKDSHPNGSSTSNSVQSHFGGNAHELRRGVLGTAIVRVSGENGDTLVRVLLDGGSTNSYITHSLAKKLGMKIQSVDTEIYGLSGATVGSTQGLANFIIKPRFTSSHSYQVDAFIMERISNLMPSVRLPVNEYTHLHDLDLADPQFFNPAEVDILIGSEIFWNMLEMDKRCGLVDQPLAVKTTLGWVVAGRFHQEKVGPFTFMTNIQLNENLQRFFAAEDIPELSHLTPEEEKCEDHYISNVSRDLTTGRFTTPIPWKSPRPKLGDSKQIAIRRLLQMERRLSTNVTDTEKKKMNIHYKNEYISFMKEYIELGHMTKVPVAEIRTPLHQVNYIPHHYVLKADSTTTKFRVVFDGSVKTSSGISMNEAMLVGPTVQSSLLEILLRFRIHPVAFTADIAKMYRQILIPEEDKDMHRILWRESPSHPIEEYKLNTVTYGTAAAPYLATKTLQHLISLEKDKFPLASSIAADAFYVDDLMGGSVNKSTAISTIKQLMEMCSTAGFPLRKWTSNDNDVLSTIPEALRETKELIQLNTDSSVKTLGIHWNPIQDIYSFKITFPDNVNSNYTKRSVYSEMSTLFDPLGWLAPATVKGKLLMQKIWKLNIDWDSVLPEIIQEEWINHKSKLKLLEEIKIPRFVLSTEEEEIQLIGYADASQLAMAACVYIVVIKDTGNSKFSLLTAKTKISPLVPPTLPRLELNAAVLLVELLNKVRNSLRLTFSQIKAFSDSQIVLAWINSDPLRWKTYVKARVSKIQRLSSGVTWHHVKGKDNPADCASRGLFPDELINHHLWWTGNPDSVKKDASTDDLESHLNQVKTEEVTKFQCYHISINYNFISYFSTWKRLLSFTSLILRAQHNFKIRKGAEGEILTGIFTCDEFQMAKLELVKCAQQQYFGSELHQLKEKQQLSNNSKLICLNPFVDKHGVMRVGGRLRHADLSYDQKHPILLPRHHHVTKLIVADIHEKTFHGGPQITLSTLNQQFWLARGRDTVRFFINKCVLCTRLKAHTLQQIMGNLPKPRVTASKPFQTTGIDYAGPFNLKYGPRSKIIEKAYLAIFVCFSTRALHLEIASSLSTEAFIAALRRFVSTRGIPHNIYTDCGTNFVGAKRSLTELHQLFKEETSKKRLADEINQQGIHWHFNPPGAPHFGGLWEAGVKSVKKHLHCVVGKELLTREELVTLIKQIEGILNSRPMTSISTNPDDLQALTPAHFLIGGPITALPEPNLHDLKIGRLERWQLIQLKQQKFWKRWSNEFISRLQQRPKWMKEQPQLKLNSIVVIKEENYPPAKWRLGRVIALHPGEDNIVRVVTLKTMNGEVKRPITKICVLPVE